MDRWRLELWPENMTVQSCMPPDNLIEALELQYRCPASYSKLIAFLCVGNDQNGLHHQGRGLQALLLILPALGTNLLARQKGPTGIANHMSIPDLQA